MFFLWFHLCSVSPFDHGLVEGGYEFFFVCFLCATIESFTLTSSLSLNVFVFLFFYISGGLTRGLKLLFMAGSACWSVTKSDWIPEFVWPFLLFRFFLFSWPGTRLAQQHFRVFPSSSDQFKVISTWSGSQAVKKKEIQKESKGIRRRGGGGL